MDIENGEILSMVSLPDFNINYRADIKDKIYTNKITKGVYELGSIFKTFTIALALDNNLVKADTIIENILDQKNVQNMKFQILKNFLKTYQSKIY